MAAMAIEIIWAIETTIVDLLGDMRIMGIMDIVDIMDIMNIMDIMGIMGII